MFDLQSDNNPDGTKSVEITIRNLPDNKMMISFSVDGVTVGPAKELQTKLPVFLYGHVGNSYLELL